MARIALVGLSAGTAAAVRAAAAGHELAGCRAADVSADTALVVAEVDGSHPAPTMLPVPLLLLASSRARVDAAGLGERTRLVRKPCDVMELRRHIRELLEFAAEPPADAPPGADTDSDAAGPQADADRDATDWLSPPRLPVPAARVIEAARHLGGTLWVSGESGTGCQQVAAAVSRLWDPGRAPVIWQPGEALEVALSKLADAARTLWVPSLDARPLHEQHALELYLALEPTRRVVVTSADQSEDAVLAGTFLRSLRQTLSGLAVRLPPLRERPGEIAELALQTGRRVAITAFAGAGFALTEDAVEALESWDWPGNLVELDAVVARSAVAHGAASIVELSASRLLFGTFAETATFEAVSTAQAAAPRRAIVVPMQAPSGVAQGNRSLTPIFSKPARDSDAPPQPGAAGVEALLAGFAHDLRNPMSTLKTFTGLQAAQAAAGDQTLARLAGEACERIDEQLELLQRYSELAGRELGDGPLRGQSPRTGTDVVGMLAGAAENGGGTVLVQVAARAPLWCGGDSDALRLVADAIVAECRAHAAAAVAAEPALIDVRGPSVVVCIPVGTAAIDRLGKWVGPAGLPWRLAIARDAAVRAGGRLDVEVEAGELRLQWRPSVREEENDGDQADSPDRRRRSRGS